MSAEEAIVANAEYHSKLLSTIAELEYVPSAKKHQISYVRDLDSQLAACKERIVELAETTKKERKEHESLRDSTGRRFAHKLMGKREAFEAKESKEEREYVEALERELTERDNAGAIAGLLDEAKRVLGDLTGKEMKFHSAQEELKALYIRVFEGPSESFPEEDRLEYDLNAAIKRYEDIQAKINSESRAAELLSRASKTMDNCQRNMEEALGYSRYDMWGGNNMADMMERNALRTAKANASQVEMLINQAVRICPTVKRIPQVQIAKQSYVSDFLFDNIFTDLSFHNKIKQSAAQVRLSNGKLKVERDAARRRADAAGAQLLHAAKVLDTRRQELDTFRKATFESYAAAHPPPPSYEFVTAETVSNFPAPISSSSNLASGRPSAVDSTSPRLTSSPPPFVPQERIQPQAWPAEWGSRNPYALALAEQTRSLSSD